MRNLLCKLEREPERLPRGDDGRIKVNRPDILKSASTQVEQRCGKAVEVGYAQVQRNPSGICTRTRFAFQLHTASQHSKTR
jgi:hypothetical protein